MRWWPESSMECLDSSAIVMAFCRLGCESVRGKMKLGGKEYHSPADVIVESFMPYLLNREFRPKRHLVSTVPFLPSSCHYGR
ncbi:3'-5' ssDNA/RNA exonuclease TatD [Trichinella spiralis]|uniref:3'-5' ssDNA/RNA exonuclease TatD n=1 Tax=Trichinella spiralis TaxID=6334 RepID=A0ABR3KHE4_TRISP